MNKWFAIACVALLLAGCASIQKAKEDVQLGFTEPLAEGEVSPQEKARPIAQNVTGAVTTLVPATAPIATPLNAGLASILGIFFAWQRGRSIRKSQPISTNPITGFLGDKTALEGVVQNLSTISQGITEVFKEGSAAQHVWQGAITALLGIAGSALAIPEVKTLVLAHPQIALAVSGIAGIANGLQQSLTRILPVATIPSTVTSAPPTVATA